MGERDSDYVRKHLDSVIRKMLVLEPSKRLMELASGGWSISTPLARQRFLGVNHVLVDHSRIDPEVIINLSELELVLRYVYPLHRDRLIFEMSVTALHRIMGLLSDSSVMNKMNILGGGDGDHDIRKCVEEMSSSDFDSIVHHLSGGYELLGDLGDMMDGMDRKLGNE